MPLSDKAQRERKALNCAIKYNKAVSVGGKKRQQSGLTSELVLMECY